MGTRFGSRRERIREHMGRLRRRGCGFPAADPGGKGNAASGVADALGVPIGSLCLGWLVGSHVRERVADADFPMLLAALAVAALAGLLAARACRERERDRQPLIPGSASCHNERDEQGIRRVRRGEGKRSHGHERD